VLTPIIKKNSETIKISEFFIQIEIVIIVYQIVIPAQAACPAHAWGIQ